jgi:translation elongation factor EF-Tu-like GTPase
MWLLHDNNLFLNSKLKLFTIKQITVMENKLDIILKKLINEEINKTLGNYNYKNYGNEYDILDNKDETHAFLIDLLEKLKQYIQTNKENKTDELKKVINLFSLVKDVLNDFDFVYSNNLSTISKVISNSKKLNLI